MCVREIALVYEDSDSVTSERQPRYATPFCGASRKAQLRVFC